MNAADGKIRKPWSGWGGLIRPRHEMPPSRDRPISRYKKVPRNRGRRISPKNGTKGNSNAQAITARKSG